jgi:molybdate transport system substrate-binding protein
VLSWDAQLEIAKMQMAVLQNRISALRVGLGGAPSETNAMSWITPARIAAAILASALAGGSASADDITVISSNALKPVLEQVGPEFENATGHRLVFTWGQAEILKGASFDLALLTAPVIDGLIRQGRLVGATRAAVAVSPAGLAVRKGATRPDISTVDAFKRTLLDARSIAFGEQGGTGTYLRALFLRLGIADAVMNKIMHLPPEKGPAQAAADGEAEIALTQISEILPYAGAELVGPLPRDIQLVTTYVTAIGAGTPHADAAAKLIKLITAPAVAPVLRAKGLDPAG